MPILLACWLGGAIAVMALASRGAFARAWREPALACPVLIVESDDWGFGPVSQAQRLDELAALLASRRDARGAPAVMTVGVVLAGPDTARNRHHGIAPEHRLHLDAPPLEPVRAALDRGRRVGVFALQLHGMEHYPPGCLHRAAAGDDSLRRWLAGEPLPLTETLPAALQSRWVDATTLPSRPLEPAVVAAAVAEEVGEFQRVFGELPEVAVPPTFVWSSEVERAWARHGVKTLVTPGRRYGGRGADGGPVAEGEVHRNGEAAEGGLTRIVRNDYFEPSFGHRPEAAVAALAAKTRLAQPTLLETHRANFIGEEAVARQSMAALGAALDGALARFPELRFLSTAELARHYRDTRSPLVERRALARLRALTLRLAEIPRLRKLAWATGLALPVSAFLAATRGLSGARR